MTLSGRCNMSDHSYRELVLAIQQAKLETDDERTSVKPAIARADEISSARSLAGWRKPHLKRSHHSDITGCLAPNAQSLEPEHCPVLCNLVTIDVIGAPYRSVLDRTALANWAEICMVGNPAFSLFERRE